MSKTVSLSKNLIRQKSKLILADVDKLQTLLKSMPYEEFISDEESKTIAERRLERVVNRAIDINMHLIRATGSPPPDDYTRSFLELATLKILPAKLAQSVAPAAGARNVLVHEYDDLDAKMFYTSLINTVKLFPKYIKGIETYLVGK
jgi:uncharacterized protein YutE (UPF0331/DUF86 family)